MPPPSQPPNSIQGGYRAPMPPHSRPSAPRGPGGLRAPMANRAPGVRPRAPVMRPRGTGKRLPFKSFWDALYRVGEVLRKSPTFALDC